MEQVKVGRPPECQCGTCANCKRRANYQRKQQELRSIVSEASEPLLVSPSEPSKATDAAKGQSDIFVTLPRVAAPEILGAVADDFAWDDALAPPDPEPVDKEAAQEAAESQQFEERVRKAGKLHIAIGAGAGAYVRAMIGICEANGFRMPDVIPAELLPPELVKMGISTHDLMKMGLAEMVSQSGVRLAVKYLPDDIGHFAYQDEFIVAGALGGATFAAYYASKNGSGGPPRVDVAIENATESRASGVAPVIDLNDGDDDGEEMQAPAVIGRGRDPWER